MLREKNFLVGDGDEMREIRMEYELKGADIYLLVQSIRVKNMKILLNIQFHDINL